MTALLPSIDRFAEIHRAGVIAVARKFGLGIVRGRGGLTPCPSCGSEQRGSTDRRGPVGIRHDGMGWACHCCSAKGDAVTLAAWCVSGHGDLRGDAGRAVLRKCAAAGLCTLLDEARTAPSSRPQPPRPMPTPAPRRDATRPPGDELAAVWSAGARVDQDAEVAAYLRARKLDPGTIADRDLTRALPASITLPRWCRYRGKPWTTTTHRLIVPMFSAAGKMESLHARALAPKDPKGRDKAAAAAGAELGGLVFACKLGQRLLGGDHDAFRIVQRVGIVVAEGEPDFLSWCLNFSDADEDAPAVLGVVAGSWPEDGDELAARVPPRCKVVIATHHDDAGDKYAEKIAASIAGVHGLAVAVARWRPR